MIIHLIAAARPNFMKIAPLYHELKKHTWAKPVIVHTGQHYDTNMSDVFFKNFDLPQPHIHLGVGSGTHAQQTGNVMIAYENVLMEQPADLVVVAGDVNSTIAAALAAVKLGIKVAHLEAGLRSYDRAMPEEINRILTDAISNYLWTPSEDADANLSKEGISPEKIKLVGNIMIDTLVMLKPRLETLEIYKQFNVQANGYGLVTLHRPSNVDDKGQLEVVCSHLEKISKRIPLIFPLHPRTQSKLEQFGITSLSDAQGIRTTSPLGYNEFMNLVMNAKLLITDSGGIQEETTYLGIPCLTLRENTERPVTVAKGTNQLCRPEDVFLHSEMILNGKFKKGHIPDYWDGRTAKRVVEHIKNFRSI